jgi:hypothetical protein
MNPSLTLQSSFTLTLVKLPKSPARRLKAELGFEFLQNDIFAATGNPISQTILERYRIRS